MKIQKLNDKGFSHDILAVFVVIIVAIIGVGYLVASHADPLSTNSNSAVSSVKWSGWVSLGVGNTIQTPAATSIKGTDNIDVFYANQEPPNTGTLYHDTWNGTSWTGQKNIDGLIRNPAVVTLGNVTNIFGSGSVSTSQNFRSLMESTNNGGSTWSTWQTIPQGDTNFNAAVTALNSSEYAVYTNGCAGVVMKGQNICQNVWTGSSWSGWQNIGGNALSAPAVATSQNGTSYLFIQGSNGVVYENVSSGKGWTGWQSIGGDATTTPAAVAIGNKKVEVFIRQADNSNYGNTWNGTSWTGWVPLGGTDLTPPANGDSQPALPGLAATTFGKHNNKIAIFTVGTNNQIFEDTLN